MRDFRLWWGLFVFFAVLSVLVVQRGYRRWRSARDALAAAGTPVLQALEGRVRREGWRLASMGMSVVAMTALVFAALLGASRELLLALRWVAVGGVAAVVWLSFRR
ncbi:MAG: hypothetical protein ACTHM9_14640 [Gemmatimonadales bacterium]